MFRWLFAIIGFVAAGFTAGLLGFAVGWAVDKVFKLLLGSPHQSSGDEGSRPDAADGTYRERRGQYSYRSRPENFTQDILTLAAYVAKSDANRLLRSEMLYVRQYLQKALHKESVRSEMLLFRDILDRQVDIHAVCRNVSRRATASEKLLIMHFLFGFAVSNGEISSEEMDALLYISRQCGVGIDDFMSLWAIYEDYMPPGMGGEAWSRGIGGDGHDASRPAAGGLEADYRILEIRPEATDDEVKKAYHAAAMKHHPDRVSHLGEQYRKTAEVKFARVNEAYRRIKASRGMN